MQMQWYVTATRSGSGERLRMPFYLRPTPSLPASPVVAPQNFSGILPAGDSGLQLRSGATYIDHTFTVAAGVYRIDARLDYTAQNVEDLDFYLYGPDGKEVTHSAISGGPEQFSTSISQAGDYKYRVVGFANGPVQYTIVGSLFSGPPAPTMQAIPGDFTNAAGDNVDFDGSFNVQWTPKGGEQGFELEKSTDNQNWDFVADLGAGTTSYAVSNQADGQYFYRVRGLTAGQIGQYVTAASSSTKIVVSQRTKVDITSQVSYPLSNVSLVSGVWQQDVNLINNSTQTYVPFVDFNVVGIQSASGTVRVINADNGKTGTSPANAALFGFSQKLGSDQIFSSGETTGSRTVRFQDSASEMFIWDVVATAYVGTGGSSSSSSSAPAGAQPPPAGSGAPGNLAPLTKITAVMRFTANPLTKTVTAQLISLK